MQNFSSAYQTKMFDRGQTHRLKGTIGDQRFTDDDVQNVTWSGICSNQNVLIGSAAVSKLQITFLNPIYSRDNWEGKVIKIYDGTFLPDSEEWEDILIGTFWVSVAEWTNVGTIEVTAYDCLSLMDEQIAFDQTSGTIYDYLKFIELKTGASYGLTRAETSQLPNGLATIEISEDSGMTTYRDLLSKIAQLVGGYAVATRDGSFVIRSFNDSSVLSIPLDRRFAKAKYSDFTTRFDYLAYTDSETGDRIILGDSEGSGMDIGENPFLQIGSDAEKSTRAASIWDVVQTMTYTPFTVSVLPSFCVLDLGDVVTFLDDYTGNDSSGAIMSMKWVYGKSVTLQCYGSKPKLKKGKSDVQNEINSIRSKKSDSEMIYHTFLNVDPISLGDDNRTRILRFKFSVATPKVVLIFHEVNLDLMITSDDGIARCTVSYYLNGELQSYTPVETWNNDGKHLIETMYFLRGLEAGAAYQWAVYITISGGTAKITRENARAVLMGQGLRATEKFDGTLECEDTIGVYQLGLPIGVLAEGTCDLTVTDTNPRLTEDGELRTLEDGEVRYMED